MRVKITLGKGNIMLQKETEVITCPVCGGTGVYEEYDDDLVGRYYVHACYNCDGAGDVIITNEKEKEKDMSLQEHYVISALTYKYRRLENNIIFAERNLTATKEPVERARAILDSFKETLDILGYIYHPVQKQVVKSITLNSRNG